MTDAFADRPWYREPLVWLLVLFPAIAVVAGFVTLYLAIVSYDGLVVDDYYQHGKEINRVLARDRMARHHGLEGTLRLDRGRGAVELRLTASDGYVLPGTVRIRWLHATRGGHDRELVLARGTDGAYAGALPSLVAGHWYVQLEADDWRLLGSLSVPGAAALLLQPRPSAG